MLHKIAPPPNPSTESKKLALNLIELIYKWETKRICVTSPQATPLKREGSGQPLGPPPTKEKADYVIPMDLRRGVIKYLITLTTSLQEKYPVHATELKSKAGQKGAQPTISNDMIRKAMQLLQDLLSPTYWPDVDVGLYENFLEPFLAGEKADKPDEKHFTCMINGLQVLRILLSNQGKEWISSKIETIQKLLDKSLKMEDPEIQDCLHAAEHGDDTTVTQSLLQLVFDAIPEERASEEDDMELDDPSSEFVRYFSTLAVDGLNA